MLVNAPGYVFSLPGVALGALGVVSMALVLSGVSVNGVSPGVRSMIAGSLCTIVGYQVATLGVFATITSDPISDADGVVSRTIHDHLDLAYGATLGIGLFAGGSVYLLALVYRWLDAGFGPAAAGLRHHGVHRDRAGSPGAVFGAIYEYDRLPGMRARAVGGGERK